MHFMFIINNTCCSQEIISKGINKLRDARDTNCCFRKTVVLVYKHVALIINNEKQDVR